ncbi:MAG TPA: sigma-54 dependent transcriptional regulator, partial [Desulfopila sp.]|nr:sigma-54 dependent transcriptional regulator [Desulfopila sp.]
MTSYSVHRVKDVKVLVVDDEPSLAEFVGETLGERGYTVDVFIDPRAALEAVDNTTFDLALVDINMPDISGVELSRQILEHSLRTEIIIITGVPDEKNLDPCLQMGLTHYLFKPFNESQLVYSAYAALHHNRLRSALDTSSFGKSSNSNLVGISKNIREIRYDIMAIANTDIPVLILGPSGTGKEVIAQDIHHNSGRSQKPFIPINCAILGDLAETELFGHVKGAFTGAAQSTTGYIGAAEGGTLFFDEVAELSSGIQAKLLRFLDNGEYSKVGEAVPRESSVRILAATNRDLQKMVDQGSFREDLYYRLQGTVIPTTGLDARKNDILPLIYYFLEVFGTSKKTTYEISFDAAALLMEAEWPGNVRQLKQTLYKITQLSGRRKIGLSDVRRVVGGNVQGGIKVYRQAKKQVLGEFDREYFLKVLSLSEGSLQKALELSG